MRKIRHQPAASPGFTSRLVATAVLLTGAAANAGEPYLPESDDAVLERLPRVLLAGDNKLRELRQRLSEDPDNVDLAAELATRYLGIGSESGDPRYYGYARAALANWWDQSDAPDDVLLIRAKLHEKDHGYQQALSDLETLVARKPNAAQAWFEIANLNRVLGEYDAALRACDQLPDETMATLCRLPILAVTGKADEASAELEQISRRTKEQWPEATSWVLCVQAKLLTSLGDTRKAEVLFTEALAEDPRNTYLLRTYADLLLDQGRDDEVIALLEDHTADNGVLLRAAIAAKRSGPAELAEKMRSQLANRFEEIRLRGNDPHGRYEARFELEINGDAERALRIALANWSKQKELRDSRNVLEAAVAAANPEAARPVLAFLSKNHTQDKTLERLVERLEK